jgi:predicted Zn-dependent peptidase
MKPKTTKLRNGLRTLLVPVEGGKTATALVLVECGSKYETKKVNGISHFLEHLCFKGTTNRPNQVIIANELDGMGAEYNAFTGHEYTGYYAKSAAGFLPHSLDLLADIYSNSLFNEIDIEKEKGAIVGEIDMYEDMPIRKVNDLFLRLLYGDQPAGWEIAGPKELITTFHRKDFLKYRELHYVPSATTVVVAGTFDQKKVLRLITEKFGNAKRKAKVSKAPVNDSQSVPRSLIAYKDSDQTHLVLGVRSYPLLHASNPALLVMAGVLGGGMGSRLFQRVRTEMGLGYYVRAANDSFTDHGVFAASAGVVNERAPEAVTAILAEFTRLKEELVPEEELERVKEMLGGRMLLGLESSDELAEFYGFQEVLKGRIETPEAVIKKMGKVTAKEIRDLARKIFIPSHLNLALIGPWKDEKRFTDLLRC